MIIRLLVCFLENGMVNMQLPGSLNSTLLPAGCLAKNHINPKVTNNCQILSKEWLLIPVISEVLWGAIELQSPSDKLRC